MDYGALTHPVVDRRDTRRSWKKAALLLVALGAVACVVAVATTPEVKPLQGVSAVTNVEATPQWGFFGAAKRAAEEHARNIARAAADAARRVQEHAARVAEEARRAAEAVRRKAEEAARAAKELLQRKERERKDRIQRNHGNFCADEHRTCHCTGTVKFGGDFDTSRNPLFLGGGKWTSKGVGGAISCTVRAFGRDPAFARKKKCYCRPGPAPTPAPTTPAPTSMPTYHPTPPPPTPQPTRPHYDGGGSKMGIVNPVFDF
jgi:hypothetical protein